MSVEEVKFRVMTTARVFHDTKTGTITQMFIDDTRVGLLPGDPADKKTERFIGLNSDALGLAVAMCLLHIAEAKTQEEKEKAAQMKFSGGGVIEGKH